MMQGRVEAWRSSTIRAMLAGVPEEWVAVKENAAIADGFVGHAAGGDDAVRPVGRHPEGAGAAGDVPDRPGDAAPRPRGGLRRQGAGRRGPRGAEGVPRAAAKKVPEEATFGNNKAADLFAVGRRHAGGRDPGSARGSWRRRWRRCGRRSTKEDELRYDEPPDWFVPVRHALGATLLKAGQPAEAEAVYREDLPQLAGQRLVAVRAGREPGGPGQEGRGGGGRRAVRRGVEAGGREAAVVVLLRHGVREEGLAGPAAGATARVVVAVGPAAAGLCVAIQCATSTV